MNQQQYSELDDMFSGGGAPTIKFTNIGDGVIGVIADIDVRQQRDFDTNELKTWDDGKPMMEIILTLNTTLNDPTIEDDDGQRRVFVRGAMLTALRQAVRVAKVSKPEIGGRIAIDHSGLGDVKKRGFSAPKLYQVGYEPPQTVALDTVFDDPAPVDIAATGIAQADALAAAAAMDPAQLAALLAQMSK